MDKRAPESAWKFKLKYSTRVANKCYIDSERIEDRYASLDQTDRAMRRDFLALSSDFSARAAEDISLWDCNAMYPAPKRTTMDWWELVTGVAKQGFAIFN